MAKNLNVLFVDDEERVLRALQKALRNQKEWTTEFVDNGQKALTYLAQNDVDVIVSDMRMPEMSGEQLLSKVLSEYPRVSRIVLSGQCDQETAFRLVGSDHLYLSKPCPTELLVETIQNAYLLNNAETAGGEVLSNEALQNALCDMTSMLLMRGLINIRDVPSSLLPLISESLLNSFAPEIASPFPDDFDQVFEEDYDWTEDLR